MDQMTPITQAQALDYEITASWWASWISNDLLQDLAARYFAWKIRRKFGRYQASKATLERIKRENS